MSCTTIRHPLSAFVALALVTTCASGAMSKDRGGLDYSYGDTMVHEQGKPKTSKGLTAKQKRPVACDCTNCSASHCNVDYYEDFNIWGNNGGHTD